MACFSSSPPSIQVVELHSPSLLFLSSNKLSFSWILSIPKVFELLHQLIVFPLSYLQHGYSGKTITPSMAMPMSATSGSGSSLHLRRPWPVKKGEASSATAVVGWRRKGKVKGLCAEVSGGGRNQVSVDRVNGRKVNGVVHGSEAPSSMGTGTAAFGAGDGGGMVSVNAFKLGRFVEDRFVYRQTFVIRSYEIGPDKTATMETLMNLLQVLHFYFCLRTIISSFLSAHKRFAELKHNITVQETKHRMLRIIFLSYSYGMFSSFDTHSVIKPSKSAVFIMLQVSHPNISCTKIFCQT